MTFRNDLLAGRTILVTGASSGIGREVARLVSRLNGRVLAAGRARERLEETLKLLEGPGHSIHQSTFEDVEGTTEWMVQLAADRGPIDGVFHAAGTELVRPIRMTKNKQFSEAFAPTLMAAAGIARAAAAKNVMADRGASIVFMSSVAGSRGQTGMAAYSAAKAAIDGLARSLACEFAPRAIRVNTIVAGAVRTEMHNRLTSSLTSDTLAAYEAKHLLGFGTALDIANVGIFLLSDAARWITGASWTVDGGYSVR